MAVSTMVPLCESLTRRLISRTGLRSVTRSLSGDTAFHVDWPAERGGPETPVSREVFPKENGRKCWRSFASQFGSIVQRTGSPSVRSGGGR